MKSFNIKKTRDNAIVPKRGTKGSAGLDLHACLEEPVLINSGDLVLIPSGIAIALPDENYVAYIFARSGLAAKFGVCLSNGVGVVDSDYRGEIKIAMCNVSNAPYTIQPGDRVAQLVISPVALPIPIEVEDLEETERGDGGFGSTGK